MPEYNPTPENLDLWGHHVNASQEIRQRIENRLDTWGEGKHAMLVEDMLRVYGEYLTVAWREETAEHRTQTYHILVLCGKLRTAVRWIMERETGGVLQPGTGALRRGTR